MRPLFYRPREAAEKEGEKVFQRIMYSFFALQLAIAIALALQGY